LTQTIELRGSRERSVHESGRNHSADSAFGPIQPREHVVQQQVIPRSIVDHRPGVVGAEEIRRVEETPLRGR
jgi:hypothetical protein